MDYSAYLQSQSLRHQSQAAIFLRAEGAKGAKYLPELLSKCQAVNSTKHLERFEEILLGFGAMTMGHIVGQIGFDTNDPLHVAILRWILQTTSSTNLRVAAHSIYGVGDLRSCHPEALERLSAMVIAPRRNDEHEHVSLRAVALRILIRLDSKMAETFVDAPAFEEYAHAIAYWKVTDSKIPQSLLELQAEQAWLEETKNRRTKP